MAKRKVTRLRGYGAAHQQLRKIWDIRVQQGDVNCWRCHKWIEPGTPWDLGHDDHDRTKYKGPEHSRCNRGAPRRHVITRNSRNSRKW